MVPGERGPGSRRDGCSVLLGCTEVVVCSIRVRKGAYVGMLVGTGRVGSRVGYGVGMVVGSAVGITVGRVVGRALGKSVGVEVGLRVGQ
jgi:hypothetical protein